MKLVHIALGAWALLGAACRTGGFHMPAPSSGSQFFSPDEKRLFVWGESVAAWDLDARRRAIDRYTHALGSADEKPDAVVRAIALREKRVVTIEAELAAQRVAPRVIDLEVQKLEQEARRRLADLRSMMGRNTGESHIAIQELLDGPLTFKPVKLSDGGKRYEVSGRIATGALFHDVGDPNGSFQPQHPVARRAGAALRRGRERCCTTERHLAAEVGPRRAPDDVLDMRTASA